MFKTRRDVDQHVQKSLANTRPGVERDLRGLTIAKLYLKISDWSKAEEYLLMYLRAKEDNDQAHKLLAQCYKNLKKYDEALKHYKRSMQLNSKQPDLLAEVCRLLIEDKNLSATNAKYWCDLAEKEKLSDELVFSLRLQLRDQDEKNTTPIEDIILKEIAIRPHDVSARVSLLRSYVKQQKLHDAFTYAFSLELSMNENFNCSYEWYKGVWHVLAKYELLKDAKKDWKYWLLTLICLERQLYFALCESVTNISDALNFLFHFDQYLFKFSQISESLNAQRELVEFCEDHYRGQLMLHIVTLLFKRELLQNKNKWKEVVHTTLPFMLLGYQIDTPDTRQTWLKHCDDQSRKLVLLWTRETAFRASQLGRTLLSCVVDDKSSKENSSTQVNQLLGCQNNGLWQNGNDLLNVVRQICSDNNWRRNTFPLIFTSSEQKMKENSSYLTKTVKLQVPVYDLPDIANLEESEEAAQLLHPQLLEKQIYLCLCNENLAEVRARYFTGLNFSVQNLNYCSPESLNQLDIDCFLYATTIQAKRQLEVERETYDSYNSGNRNASAKPRFLPYALISTQLCTKEQSQWWHAAYKFYKDTLNPNKMTEIRSQLLVGLEAMRGVHGPKMDLTILFKLAQLLVARSQGMVKASEKTALEVRAEALYTLALNMYKKHQKGHLEPFNKYFKYAKNNTSAVERAIFVAAEDAVSYLSARYFKKSDYQAFIDELNDLLLPTATYMQAEAYRKLEESIKTPKKLKTLYFDRRTECLEKTELLLKNETDHPLNSLVAAEIKRQQQSMNRRSSNKYEIESFASPVDLHNNSSTYEDAEEDFYAASTINFNRTRRESGVTTIASQELEKLVKQMAATLITVKEELLDNIKPQMDSMQKEISTLRDQMSQLETSFKKTRIVSRPPSRDDASQALDDFFLLDEALQNQQYNPQTLAQQTTPHPPAPSHFSNMYNPAGAVGASPFMPPNQQHHPAQLQQQHNQQQRFFAPNPMTAFNNQMFSGIQSPLNYYSPQTQYMSPSQGPLSVPPNNILAPRSSNFPINMYPQNFMDGTGTFNMQQLLPQLPTSVVGATPNLPTTITTPSTLPSVINPPIVSTAQSVFNKALNNQPVEKGPPANVVITSSDPLPKPTIGGNLTNIQQPKLSVTIPPQHIKPSLVQTPEAVTTQAGNTGFNFSLASSAPQGFTTPSPFKGFGQTTATTTTTPAVFGSGTLDTNAFSFKPQIAAVTAEKASEVKKESINEISYDEGEDEPEIEYDPRPDFKPIIPLPDEVEVRTGEEDETVMFSNLAKLYRHVDKEWKERGKGELKILKNKEGYSRVLMRREQTHKICANHRILPEISITQAEKENKALIWAANDFADEETRLEKFFVRFKTHELADEFKKAFNKAQKETEELEKNKNKTMTVDSTQDIQAPTKPFALAKSNAVNSFMSSTPATNKNEGIGGGALLVKPTIAASTVMATPPSSTATKSLFGSLATNDSSKSNAADSNTKPAAPSPFANFSFGASAINLTTNNATNTAKDTTMSPFANIFNNLGKGTQGTAVAAPHFSIRQNEDSTLIFGTPIAKPKSTESTSMIGIGDNTEEKKQLADDVEEDFVPTAQFEPVIALPDLVEVNTGEENENVLFEHRAKLLRYVKETSEWKERGVGNIKLLQNKNDVNQLRLLMRREQVHKLCCNQRLAKDTKFSYAKNSETALTWAGQDFSEEYLSSELLCVRFKTAEICKNFQDAVLKAQALIEDETKDSDATDNDNKDKENKTSESVKGFGDKFKPQTGSWNCDTCYVLNNPDKLYCLACDTPKDNTVPNKENTGNALNLSTSSKFTFGFGAVTGENNTTASSLSSSNVSNNSSGGGSFNLNASQFSADNSQNYTNKIAAGTIGFGDAFKPKAGTWNCEECYVVNSVDALYCNACKAPKDKTVPKKEPSSGVLSLGPAVGAPKFNFGFGDAFKPKEGTWSCEDCYVANSVDALYCNACKAPKDKTVPKKEPSSGVLSLGPAVGAPKFNFGFNAPQTTSANTVSSTAFSFGTATTTLVPPTVINNEPKKNLFSALNANTKSDASKSFTFVAPTATSTTVSSDTSVSGFTFNLPNKQTDNFSINKEDFSFTLKPKSTGKTQKTPTKESGADEDDDNNAADNEYHEEEENNTYFTPVIPLPDKIDVKTGEEDEDILYVHRAKLFRLSDNEWKERGLGDVKILRHKQTQKLRVVMRREQVLKICLNHVLNDTVGYKRKDDKSWLFIVHDFSEGQSELNRFVLRFKNADIATEFYAAVQSAQNGTALPIEPNENAAANVSTDKLSDQKSSSDAVDTQKAVEEVPCKGCRGCDSDTFVFQEPKSLKDFVISDEDEKKPDLPMHLPVLTLPAKKLGALTPSKLSTQANESNIFTGFGNANSTAFATAEQKLPPSNVTFSFTETFNSTKADNKPNALAGGFVFGGVGAGDKKPIFGQTPSIFGGGGSIGNNDTNTIKSIFGGGGATTSEDNVSKSIFSKTPTENKDTNANQTKSIFGGSGDTTNTTSIFGSTATGTATSGGNLFGSFNTTPNPGSIFGGTGSTTTTMFSSTISTENSIFGGASAKPVFGATPVFGSISKKSDASANDGKSIFSTKALESTPLFGSSNTISFADQIKPLSSQNTTTTTTESTAAESGFGFLAAKAAASDDFASLAAKVAVSPGDTSKDFQKNNTGGFIGLKNQNAFASFLKPSNSFNNSLPANDSTKENDSVNKSATDGVNADDNDENYDPHYEPIIPLPEEIVVSTGEEDETKMFGERSMLYRWDNDTKEWKERGVGELKILFHPKNQTYRMVMRREQIHKLVLNHTIHDSMSIKILNNNPKSFVWFAVNYAESNEGAAENLAVRFKKLEQGELFSKTFEECIKGLKSKGGGGTEEENN